MQKDPFGLIEIVFLSGMESYFLRFSRVIESPVALSSRECFASWRDKFLFRVVVYSAVSQVKMPSYILIRCPAQPNIKHLSCNKQPLMGCVNTSRV